METVAALNWATGLQELDDVSTGGMGHGVSYHIPANEYEVMQFTGLKDKAGKEIYEGDIIRVRSEDGGAWTLPEIWAVKFNESSADFRCYNPAKYKETAFYPLHSYDLFEIVGNIYENPELVK